MRRKYTADDYRFANEADITPIPVDREWIEEIRKSLPELPHAKKMRFMEEHGLSEYDAGVLTQSKELAHFFEATLEHVKDAKLLGNWMMGDVLRRLKDEDKDFDEMPISSRDLADLINLVREDKINNNTGKKVLREMFETGKAPEDIVKEKGLIQISDEGELERIVMETLDNNPQSIEDYKNGKDRAIGFLVGQIMKATKGKANPQLVNKLLTEKIKER
jgi:aspartyl-tRNA(Asn)/glutamyl-tRNA(Gln) amidotransferase subunit B